VDIPGSGLKFSFASTKAKKDYTYQPIVSVLMPCYNEVKTVYETIESIIQRQSRVPESVDPGTRFPARFA